MPPPPQPWGHKKPWEDGLMGKWGVVGPSTWRETRRNQLQGSRRETNTWLGVLPLTWDMYHWGMSDITKGCFLELCVLARTFWKEQAEVRDSLLSVFFFFWHIIVRIMYNEAMCLFLDIALRLRKQPGFTQYSWCSAEHRHHNLLSQRLKKSLLCSRLLSVHLYMCQLWGAFILMDMLKTFWPVLVLPHNVIAEPFSVKTQF